MAKKRKQDDPVAALMETAKPSLSISSSAWQARVPMSAANASIT